jgi:hypothetical protein
MQAIKDFTIFGTVAIASGWLHHESGWPALSLATLSFLALATLFIVVVSGTATCAFLNALAAARPGIRDV